MAVFRRLLGFLGPDRHGVIASFVLAAAAMGFGVLIPKLIGMTVDNIDEHGGEHERRDHPVAVGAEEAEQPAEDSHRLLTLLSKALGRSIERCGDLGFRQDIVEGGTRRVKLDAGIAVVVASVLAMATAGCGDGTEPPRWAGPAPNAKPMSSGDAASVDRVARAVAAT